MLFGWAGRPGFQDDFTILKPILVLSRLLLIFGPSPSYEMMARGFNRTGASRLACPSDWWRALRRRPSASAAIRALRTFSAVIGTGSLRMVSPFLVPGLLQAGAQQSHKLVVIV